MSSVDEQIVCEYLENNGFLVQPLRKSRLQSKRSQQNEGVDFYIRNVKSAQGREPSFLLFSSELSKLQSALVCVRGWHGDKAALASVTSGAEMFRYLETTVLKKVEKWFDFDGFRALGEKEMPKKVLVAPAFPTQEPFRKQCVAALKEKGVDGILSFKSMVLDLIDRVDTKQVYVKSDLLQFIRMLKTFDLIKDSQMTF